MLFVDITQYSVTQIYQFQITIIINKNSIIPHIYPHPSILLAKLFNTCSTLQTVYVWQYVHAPSPTEIIVTFRSPTELKFYWKKWKAYVFP